MKKTLTLLALVISALSFSQDFTFDINGINTLAVVKEVDSTNAEQLYIKSINWIKETYANPDKVIKTEILNEKIRIQGFKETVSSYMSHGTDLKYTIELDFKDNRYRFVVSNLEINPADGGFRNFDITDSSKWYKKNGSLKGWFKPKVNGIVDLLNDLNNSLYNYITAKKEEW